MRLLRHRQCVCCSRTRQRQGRVIQEGAAAGQGKRIHVGIVGGAAYKHPQVPYQPAGSSCSFAAAKPPRSKSPKPTPAGLLRLCQHFQRAAESEPANTQQSSPPLLLFITFRLGRPLCDAILLFLGRAVSRLIIECPECPQDSLRRRFHRDELSS
jgi:hypothetical protein